MKDLERADRLFELVSHIKAVVISQKNASMAEKKMNRAIWDELLQVMGQMQEIYHSFGIEDVVADEMWQTITTDVALCESNHSFCQLFAAYEKYINRVLLQTIIYRQYYCVIRRNDNTPGLASHIITNLGQILKSLKAGYIPVIDTYQVDNIFTPISKACNRNAWELYFKQPLGFGLDDVKNAKRIIVADGIPDIMPSYNMECLTNPVLLQMWRKVCRKYMPFSEEMHRRTEKVKQECFGGVSGRVLGVLCRGTDYTTLRPYNHPVQPLPEQTIEVVKQKMKQRDCSFCYLVTEDRQILRVFQESLGERLLFSQSQYYDTEMGQILSLYNEKHDIDVHEKNVEYLIALSLLSKCDCLVAGRTSGTVAAMLFADDFMDVHIWNEGRYGVDDESVLASYLY